MLFKTKFVLASASKSRYFILKNSGLSFYKHAPLCDENTLKKSLLEKKTTPKIKIFKCEINYQKNILSSCCCYS